MIVVIDTNVVMAMFKRGNPCRPIFDAWIAGEFCWAVSTEIMIEYEEIIGRMSHPQYVALVFETLSAIGESKQNLLHFSPAFRFQLVPGDADDNKFTDCAVTAHADYIITSDRHFNLLSGSGYKPQPITPAAFIERCL